MPHQQLRTSKVLSAALLLQLVGIAYFYRFLAVNEYLPSPFVLDKSDTFMDLFNTMWWGAQDYRYTEWGSVYPPLNFLVLDVLRSCFAPFGVGRDPSLLRSSALSAGYFIAFLHILAPFLVVSTTDWRVLNRANRTLVAFICVLSPVILFSMERGNLIILALFILPFLMAKGRENISPILLAVLINIKPYFALLMLAYLFKGDVRRFLQAVALAGSIFIFTGLAVDADFPLFMGNLFNFASGDVLSGREVLALPASLSAFSYAISIFLKASDNPGIFESLLPALPPIIDGAKNALLLFGVFTLFVGRREMKLQEGFTILLAIAIVAGVWAGGYSQMFYIACVPVLAATRFGAVHLSILLMIFIPWDILTIFTDNPLYMMSFISHSAVGVEWQLGVGSIVRPLLNALFIISLCAEILTRRATEPETKLA